MEFTALAQKGRIGKLELKNRIVMPPFNNNYTKGGFMTDESVDFYVSRAKGGVGLIIVEATSVDYPRSRSVLNPAINDDKYIPGLKRIVDGCRPFGVKIMVQLSHVGRQTTRTVTGMEPIAPSAISSKSAQYTETPRALTIPEIHELLDMYGAAGERAKRIGFDGVEIIMGHGYLINNFLSSLSNFRTDAYGGLKGGLKFAGEVVRKIKETCGKDFPIIARYNIDDFVRDKGNTPVEGQLIAQELERAGVDAISASGGMRDSELNYADHSSRSPRGAWIHLAHRVKRVVSIPVMAVKRITPELAEEAVRNGKADFICFGKPLIADPDFANKILSNRLDDAIHCTSCCQGCYDQLWQRIPITCTYNPEVGRPVSYKERRAAARGGRKVLVIGGGPAGCEAALEAAKKGHAVALVEKNARLGGNYLACKYTGVKQEVAMVFAGLERRLRKSMVDIRLDTPFSVELLDEIRPKVVVDATGAGFMRPPIKGADLPIVMNPVEALDGCREVGDYVAVVSCGFHCTWTCGKTSRPIPGDIVGLQTVESHACSAGHAAADVAEELANRGKKVFILTARDAFVPGMGYTNRSNMMKRFFPLNIAVSNRIEVKEIMSDGLICEKDGMEFKLCADTVVMSVGMTRRNAIAKLMEGRSLEFHQVGDAAKIGNALRAFHTGYEIVDAF